MVNGNGLLFLLTLTSVTKVRLHQLLAAHEIPDDVRNSAGLGSRFFGGQASSFTHLSPDRTRLAIARLKAKRLIVGFRSGGETFVVANELAARRSR